MEPKKEEKTPNIYALWEFNPMDGIGNIVKLSSSSTYNADARTYHGYDGLVLCKSSRVSGTARNGCTKITSPDQSLKMVYVLTMAESVHGEWDITELYIMFSLEMMTDFVQRKFRRFAEDRCYNCVSAKRKSLRVETVKVLDTFIQTHKVKFGECMRDFEIYFTTIHCESA